MNCYNFVEYNFDQGLFDKTIDATYIIHLENNGRINHVLEQINKYKPTKKIYILFNKGYKNCNKNLTVNCPNNDLAHCNLTIFKHAKLKNYNNIIILEDDFIFSDKIKNQNIINDLNNFFIQHTNEKFIYNIGGIPTISIPYQINHYKAAWLTTAHCIMYSKGAVEYLVNNENDLLNIYYIWDIFLFDISQIQKYHYKYPLCYQTFPVTESQKYWKLYKNPYINKFVIDCLINCIKFLNLHKTPEPGFTIIYTISISLFYILIFASIYFIYRYIQVRRRKINI